MSAPARLGRYRVDRRVGSGSFATVWLAHDEVLDAPVAVKVLADNWAHRLDVRERFEEEARILRRADSDRVVRVHDIGELDDGRPYFVMTYADRGTLADRIAAGPVPAATAVRYAADVARGLAVLHEVGVIHRDVKPANVLLRSGRGGLGDRVLIADLGLAKAAAHGSGVTLTVGTPGYMAPEQAAGEGISKRTDVYAVGALLRHLLTGVAPDPEHPLPAEREAAVPPAVHAVLRQALARRPEDRFPSAGALADALDAAAVELAADPSGERVPAAPGVADETVELRRPRSRRRLALLLGLVAALALGAGGVAAWRLRADTVEVSGAAGAVRVRVPAGWGGQLQDGPWDLGPYGQPGRTGQGLAVAAEVAGWRDPGRDTPGVFVGVARGVAEQRLLRAPAAGCRHRDERRDRGGLAGTVRRHEPCGGSAARVVEAVLRPPGAAYLVFVQVKEPAGSGEADRVLDSLRVDPAPVS